MSIDWNKINNIHDTVSANIKAEEGRIWKASASELHSDYNEMPFWILLYEDSNIDQVHKAFKEIVSPFFTEISPVQCTVAYILIEDGNEVQVDFLDNNREISAAPEEKPLGRRPMNMGQRQSSVFKGLNSR